MTLVEILSIIIIHWFADFVVQTDEQAQGKSKHWKPLLMHTFSYTWVWTIVGAILTNPFYRIWGVEHVYAVCYFFPIVTLVAHTITDYFTSRINARLWSQGKVHMFFVSIGLDQVLHYFQLFLTYYWVKQFML